MNVALAYNAKLNTPNIDLDKQEDLEFDSPEVTKAQKEALEALGHKVYLVEADLNAFEKLRNLKNKIDIVFNVAEGLVGDARESQIPMFCEILGIPYTHSSPTVHAIALDKSFTKLILKGVGGINVPHSQVIKSPDYRLRSDINLPVIVKPNKEGSSKGVLDIGVVKQRIKLANVIRKISENFTKEVLVEEYIDGREFTVAVVGNKKPKVLPIIEQKFDFLPKGMNKIAGFELKWIHEDSLKDIKDAYDCPAKLNKRDEENIIDTTERIYKALHVRDCARIDYRMNQRGKLYFIEINTLPGMIPDPNVISYFPIAARTSGMNYRDMVGKILALATKRYKIRT